MGTSTKIFKTSGVCGMKRKKEEGERIPHETSGMKIINTHYSKIILE